MSSSTSGPRYDQRVASILDSEVQRLATLADETEGPARDGLVRRAKYVAGVLDDVIEGRSQSRSEPLDYTAWTPYDQGPPRTYVCPQCSAIVKSREDHAAWHDGLQERAALSPASPRPRG